MQDRKTEVRHSNSATLEALADPNRFQEPVRIDELKPDVLLRMLEKMILIRLAEEKLGDEVFSKQIKCPCHLVIGQEAISVAVTEHILPNDRIFGAHRSHGHYLSLGGDLQRLMAEVQGKETGCSKGMGGSMHLIDLEHQLFGTVPIMGATIPMATGAGLAAKMEGQGGVAVSFFGDGATEEGVFHESMNFASLMKLPIVFVCENNLFASHLHISLRQPLDSVARYAAAHAIEWERIDGNDVVAVYHAAGRAIAAARNGRGPRFVEAVTYRWRGHVGYMEDVDVGVRRKDDLGTWKKRDPIARLAEALLNAGIVTHEGLEQRWSDFRRKVADAWTRAQMDPFPNPEALLNRVYFQRT